jgi:FolB domain-containing protein
MPDTITINNLKLECRVGVPDEERRNPQTIEVDLDLVRDLREAGATDDVSKTVDYAAVVSHLEKHVRNREYRLLEKLVEEIAAEVLGSFAVDAVQVQVRKKALKQTDWTGVEIARHKERAARRPGFQP